MRQPRFLVFRFFAGGFGFAGGIVNARFSAASRIVSVSRSLRSSGFLGEVAMSDPNEAELEQFAEAVGLAIIQWQDIESRSAHLFSHLLRARSLGAIATVYYIKNFSTRIEMMNIAARFWFMQFDDKSLQKDWKALTERLSQASALRNRIAHFEVDEEMTPSSWKFTLIPPRLDWSQLDPEQGERWLQRQRARSLAYSQIENAWRDFRKLGDDIDLFARRVIEMNAHQEGRKSPLSKLPHAQELDSGHLAITGYRKRPAKRRTAKKPKKQPSA